MKLTTSTATVCVIGHPIAHSLSPRIHNSLYQKINLDMAYLSYDVLHEDLSDAVDGMLALGFKGFNITIPHKKSMIELVDKLEPSAKQIGAINTVKIESGHLIGYNTDGQGFIQALKKANIRVKDRRVVILGAGGSARAIGVYMAKESPNSISIVNRTIEQGRVLSSDINDVIGSSIASAVNDIPIMTDIIINTTPLGMWPNTKGNPIAGYRLNPETVVCDIVYNPRMTTMLKQAEDSGCVVLDGIGMLIGQALSSIKVWTDRNIDEESWNIMQGELSKL